MIVSPLSSNDGYGRNRLPYPYSYTPELTQETDEYTTNPQPDDQSGCVSLYTVALTDAEVLQFTSALQAGADLIYPDDWQSVIDPWLLSRTYRNNPLWFVGKVMGVCNVDICDLVAECIRNNPGVIEAIEDIIRGQEPRTTGGSRDRPYEGLVEEQGDVDNDLDKVYAALVDVYDDLIRNYWDRLAVAVAGAAELTEILADLPFVSVTATAYYNALETLLTTGTALYESHMSDIGTRDAVTCAAFDLICGRGPAYTITNTDIDAMFDAIAVGQPVPFVNELIKQLANYRTIGTYWARRTNDIGNNDWETICNCTPGGWCWSADWSTIFFDSSWTNDDRPATNIGGALQLNSNGFGFITETGVPVGDCTALRMEVDVRSTTDNDGPSGVTLQARRTGTNTTILSENIIITSEPQTFDFPFSVDDDIYLRIAARTGTGVTIIDAVRLYGDENSPPNAGC